MANATDNAIRRRSTESRGQSCSERPLTLFHTPSNAHERDKRASVILNSDTHNSPLLSANCNSSHSGVHMSPIQGSLPGTATHTPVWTRLNSLPTGDPDLDGVLLMRQNRPNSLFNPRSRASVPTSPVSPSPTSPRSPSWPMFSAPSSPQPTSSSADSSPLSSTQHRRARALYACKAEHDSELSFVAGTIFENVHPSREPGWLEGTLDGRTGLIPENYVEFL